MAAQPHLWQSDAPRILSDSELARVLGITPGYVPKLRKLGWLPRRQKMKRGEAGGKSIVRYSFLDVVAVEVARTAAREFDWSKDDCVRAIKLIRSGDKERVKATKLVYVAGELPHTSEVLLMSPREFERRAPAYLQDAGTPMDAPWRPGRFLHVGSFMDMVLAIGNDLYHRMVKEGFVFGRDDIEIPKPSRRRKN